MEPREEKYSRGHVIACCALTGVMAGLLCFALGMTTGRVMTNNEFYLTCIQNHSVAECRELKPHE